MKHKTVTAVPEGTVIEKTDESVIMGTPVLTAEVEAVCTVCKESKPQTTEHFSMLKNGQLRRMCKRCQTKASLEWSAKRADYRRQYHLAVMYQNSGIPAILPTAKEWKQGDPIMTVAYTDANGTFHPSVNATELYAELKKQRRLERQKLKAERDKLQRELAMRRKAERDAVKTERERNKLMMKMRRATEREALRKQREESNAVRLEKERAERERAQMLKVKQKEANALLRAERARQLREQRILAKAEARRLKILTKAEQVVLHMHHEQRAA